MNNNKTAQPDRQSPIIIIGAGRSGSTLLSAILNAHPAISFFGETYFLAPFIWSRVFEPYGLIISYIDAWRNPSKKRKSVIEQEENARVGQLISQFLADVVRTDPSIPHWGFKEIWNGSPQFETFDWSIYDAIFPRAKYVHLIRNPFNYAISTAGRDNNTFTRSMLENQLANWVAMHRYNSERKETGSYSLLRYEDLVNNPEESIREITSFAEIGWSPECMKALEERHVPSLRNPLENNDPIMEAPFRVDGLFALAEELGYLDDISKMGITLQDDRVLVPSQNHNLFSIVKNIIRPYKFKKCQHSEKSELN